MGQELFLKNKINRQINQNGSTYTFKRFGTDEYGQLTDEVEETFVIKGLFHETIQHVQTVLSELESARVIDVPNSYLLCLFEDGDQIKLDDFTMINKQIYKVVNKFNVGNYNVAYDVALRMVANDSQT